MKALRRPITPHLWFDTEAIEASGFYCSLLPDSRITSSLTLQNVPAPKGQCDVLSFELSGQPFMAISAGPLFKPNPSISFFLNFDPSRDPKAREHLDRTWDRLSDRGQALMPLDEYPFSKRYGWIQDRFGVSWQLILTDPKGEPRPFIAPSLLFVGAVCGRAAEAIEFYLSVFRGPDSRKGQFVPYPKGMEPDQEGSVMFADFALGGQFFAAMDSAHRHEFAFNEAISLLVPCETQEEIDYYWEQLSVDPNTGQCGWLKDKFGVSWQVWPVAMGEMMSKGTPEQVARLTQAFLPMKKFDLSVLRKAFAGP